MGCKTQEPFFKKWKSQKIGPWISWQKMWEKKWVKKLKGPVCKLFSIFEKKREKRLVNASDGFWRNFHQKNTPGQFGDFFCFFQKSQKIDMFCQWFFPMKHGNISFFLSKNGQKSSFLSIFEHFWGVFQNVKKVSFWWKWWFLQKPSFLKKMAKSSFLAFLAFLTIFDQKWWFLQHFQQNHNYQNNEK